MSNTSLADKLSIMTQNQQIITNNQQKVYEAGYEKGKAEGGGDNYHDIFWDAYQVNGTRTNYRYAFQRDGWTDMNFVPKYNMAPTDAQYMFQNCAITDLKTILENCGVTLDLKKASHLYYTFAGSKITHLPVLDGSKSTNNENVFAGCLNLVSIDKFIFPSTGATLGNGRMFYDCRSLVNVTFEGIITSSIDFSSSPLSVASMKSVISCLKDYSETSSAYTNTLTFTPTRWAALEADSAAPDGGTWANYVNSLGWNI